MAKQKIGVWVKGTLPLTEIMHISEHWVLFLEIEDIKHSQDYVGSVSILNASLCNSVRPNRKTLELCNSNNSEAMIVSYAERSKEECIKALKEEALLVFSEFAQALNKTMKTIAHNSKNLQ